MIRTRTLSATALLATTLAACGGAEETPAPAPAAPAPMQQAGGPPPATRPPVASPRDTAELAIAGGQLMVDYGRPSMRGRTIMGGLVPYGQVWRTGANQATHFTTPVNLRIGGIAVPAGTYTLYTLPTADSWQLIVNRQTGQWGTEYDAARDLARIPMRVERTSAPVEQFTIALEPGSTPRLALTWENTRAWVPVEIAR